jgi:hypothetical protein
MKQKPANSPIRRIAFIGNYLPRKCGIATFTTDLCEAIAAEYKGASCLALPVNDVEGGYAYPPRVRFEILRDPSPDQRAVLEELAALSNRLVVMSKRGEEFLHEVYQVEAQAMVSACLEAYRLTDDKRWRKEARRAFDWFLGRNDLHLPIYDPATGGCRDGLHPDRPNANQGAESTLAFLQASLELRLAENDHATAEARTSR